MPPKKKGRPRKEQYEPNQASCNRSERQELVPMPPKKKGRPRKEQFEPSQASCDRYVRGCEEQVKILFDNEDIDDDSLVDMMSTFEASLSQPKDNYQKSDGFQDAMDAIIQSILHANDDKGVEEVEPGLTKKT
ncbi:unnamed protein product [Lactuca saligna]|uniref:Uncharacterized protein n=1 Tax=Lactuca saligna TaxID=75948 RepID=A0AA35Z310_LACSI|nr:unnamed protein product [Lactuca saligna]